MQCHDSHDTIQGPPQTPWWKTRSGVVFCGFLLIAERPSAKGLTVPGMPASAPGMDRPGQPYTVSLFGTPTGDQTYARYQG